MHLPMILIPYQKFAERYVSILEGNAETNVENGDQTAKMYVLRFVQTARMYALRIARNATIFALNTEMNMGRHVLLPILGCHVFRGTNKSVLAPKVSAMTSVLVLKVNAMTSVHALKASAMISALALKPNVAISA